MKIGIFGGTFNPPHIGHSNILQAFIEQFDFDEVFVIPVSLPPHKNFDCSVTADDRLNMSRLAFEKISDSVIVSDIEIKRDGKSYTADTIKYFKERGYNDIYFLCGTDMLLTLDMWYKPDYILANAKIVYARREACEEISDKIFYKIEEYKSRFNAEIYKLDINALEISSTEIRNCLANGTCEYLCPEVLDYIYKNKLYKEG